MTIAMTTSTAPPKMSSDSFKPLLLKLINTPGKFTPDDTKSAMHHLATPGCVLPAQAGAFLAALKSSRIEHLPETLAAAAEVMGNYAVHVPLDDEHVPAVDIVGTGGDGHNTFNVSTTAAIVAAGAGARVVKHGNKASTSSSGSADILLALGCPLAPPSPEPTPLPNKPFTFLLAAHHHPALTSLAPVRKALPFRTVFNVLGPLINPASPKRMILGVYTRELGPVFAETLRGMGVERALVVCGMESLDEISIAGGTWAWSLENGDITTTTLHPSHFELKTHPLSTVAGASPETNAQMLIDILNPNTPSHSPTESVPAPANGVTSDPGAILDFVLMNASALLVVAGLAPDYPTGVKMARESISSGRAWEALNEFRERDRARANGGVGGALTEELGGKTDLLKD
ncbi:anthranilate phosphoribosyltransferase [Rhizoctonia solani AG-1 IB]|uniref:Anthranilate phosphoribosyltransferase n=1 Tax=Thanatephorus cucumeris (strain AG1-IB / isolate 7/3/14) TaxID=1108050 RepID=A0A0B7FIU9_THACB|nr:anthranilate phosphoribosyltransferase [Rhizoctonia solani AG-1 IB]